MLSLLYCYSGLIDLIGFGLDVLERFQVTRHVEIKEKKTKKDWAYFIRNLADINYTEARRITLVMDNLNTHSPSALYEVFKPEEAKRIWDRFEFIYTPKHGSWLIMAEIELNVLNGQCLNRRIDNI